MKIAPISLNGTVKVLKKAFNSATPVISKTAYTEDVDKFIKTPEKLLKDALGSSKKAYVKPQVKVVSVDNSESILAGSYDCGHDNGNHNGFDHSQHNGYDNDPGDGSWPGNGNGNGHGHGHGHWDDSFDF